jgi:hypothetical protein
MPLGGSGAAFRAALLLFRWSADFYFVVMLWRHRQYIPDNANGCIV